MKRNIIYLYAKNGANVGKSAGFCRLDTVNETVKIIININPQNLYIDYSQVQTAIARFLYNTDVVREYEWRMKPIFQLEIQKDEEIVGIELLYIYKNGIKVIVCGGRNFPSNKRIKQVELSDTVYNVDMDCIEEKKDCMADKRNVKVESVEDEPVKINISELTELPRKYWHLQKNRFVTCCYNRYGYIAYIRRGDKYIICVPGSISENEVACAKRYGFNTYINSNEDSEKYYWLWGKSNGKSNKQ